MKYLDEDMTCGMIAQLRRCAEIGQGVVNIDPMWNDTTRGVTQPNVVSVLNVSVHSNMA